MKKTVAVLFGGRSAEHEISIITGLEIVNAIDSSRYDVVLVYIDARGRWFTGNELREKSFYRGLPDCLNKLNEVSLLPVPGAGGLTVINNPRATFLSRLSANREIIPVDVFFPAFHGSFGEDGCIQGVFEMADVAYTGCNVLSSAMAMNKYVCKSILSVHGVPTLPGVVIKKHELRKGFSELRARIQLTSGLESFPLFIKPVNLGSSIGVGKAENETELNAALAKAFEFDFEAIVEPCIVNKMEINVSVMGGVSPEASVVEIPVASKETLSYEDKYLRGGRKKGSKGGTKQSTQRIQGMAGLARVIDPVDLDPVFKQTVTKNALSAYNILNCSGVVRFDFMVNLDTGMVYFNELNPLPGSYSHYLWAKSSPSKLYTEIISSAIDEAIFRKSEQLSLNRDIGFKALFN